jgi:hypothetical protein
MKAREAPRGAGLGVVGPTLTRLAGVPGPEVIGERLVVVLDAASAEEAMSRVREVLSDDVVVGPAHRVGF